jgi:hypothetical protein
MHLVSAEGKSIKLTIGNYQYPSMSGSGDNDWDANWLVIHGEAHDGERGWRFSDPSLTTWEAQEIASWLRGVARGDIAPQPLDDEGGGGLTFTEPNLGLSLHRREPDAVTIRFHFSLESAPPWINDGPANEFYEFFIQLTISPSEVEAAGREWETELATFPVRRGDA